MMPMDSAYGHGRPTHGGINASEIEALGLRVEDVLDFSASINPLGPSPRAVDATRNVNLAVYPDTDCVKLREAIGRETCVPPDNILVGNGSTELIHLLAQSCLGGKDGDGLVFAPTFGEYEAACRLWAGAPFKIRLDMDGLGESLSAVASAIAGMRPSLVFLCNPNNPTGSYMGGSEVAELAGAVGDSGLLVLDEAYVSFVEERWDSTHLLDTGNVAILRSMTKDYALTGLRLGYMLASAETIERVRRFQYSWSVNALAQAAGIAALDDPEHVARGREAARIGREYLRDAMRTLGLEVAPSVANFLLIRVGRAAETRLALLKRHSICVRDCASFGLSEHIRVGVRTMDCNRRLVEALGQVLASE